MGAKRTSSTFVPTSSPISMRRGRLAGERLISATVAVVPKATEVSGWSGADMILTRFAQGFDENGLGQVLTQSDAGIADLADQTRMPADEANALLLAQAHFPEAIHHIRLCGQFLDANHGARFTLRQRTRAVVGATRVGSGIVRRWVRLIQRRQIKRQSANRQGGI
jgi:hypothetical protein